MPDPTLARSSSRAQADPATVFPALADIVYRGTTAAETYAAICVAATLIVPGCDHASVMVRLDGVPTTVAASDAVARRVDGLEREVSDGPCLDAIDQQHPQINTDIEAESQWPALAKRVAAETPVRGMMGCRLCGERGKLGALNTFSDQANALNRASIEQAVLLSAFACVTATSIANGEEAASLRRGLVSNREIGRAVGMLMLTHDVAEEQAFDELKRISQDTNIKLAQLAGEVVRRRGQLT